MGQIRGQPFCWKENQETVIFQKMRKLVHTFWERHSLQGLQLLHASWLLSPKTLFSAQINLLHFRLFYPIAYSTYLSFCLKTPQNQYFPILSIRSLYIQIQILFFLEPRNSNLSSIIGCTSPKSPTSTYN